MYCFFTAELRILAIVAIVAIYEDVIGAEEEPLQLLFFQIFAAKLWWILRSICALFIGLRLLFIVLDVIR
jgi:hypothetical protein